MTTALFTDRELLACAGLGLAPILMRRAEIINLKEAIFRAGKSERTLRAWCRTYGIGRKSSPNAPLEISAPALEMILHGDFEALDLLRAGQRSHERVNRYFRHLDLC